MTLDRQKRTLIYKRTHNGDPDPTTGVFGNKDCMGQVRMWPFDSVIGVGGIGHNPQRNGIAEKLTWIGIGPHRNKPKNIRLRGPYVTFDHFMYFGKKGPFLKIKAPALARRMYEKNIRQIMDSLSDEERKEVKEILDIARDAPPSNQLKGVSYLESKKTGRQCRSYSCRGKPSVRKQKINKTNLKKMRLISRIAQDERSLFDRT